MLLRHLGGKLHLSHRLISFEESEDDVRLYFMNGSVAVCDILIGMDGIRSVVRRGFLQGQGFLKSPSLDPIWTGTVAYRGLIPKETLQAVYPNHRATVGPMLVSASRSVTIFALKVKFAIVCRKIQGISYNFHRQRLSNNNFWPAPGCIPCH